MKCDFTFKHYKEIIKLAKRKGYSFCRVKDYSSTRKKVIYLRHDVDLAPSNAVRIAEIENRLGIKTSYYFRLHADYNPFSLKNVNIINEIKRLGHEVGLHYSPSFGELYGSTLQNEIIMFELMYGKTYSFSLHEPARTNPGEIELKGYYNAHGLKFLTNTTYISDSGGRWRTHCACEFIKKGVSRLCILTHPMWWFKVIPLEGY